MVSGVLSGVLGALSQDVAVDLGTATTRIALKGRGVICREPSAVAVRSLKRSTERGGGRQILAVGAEARAMLGRTPRDIEVVRPIRDSVIADFEVTEAMLRELMLQSLSGQLLGPRKTVASPRHHRGRRAMRECAEATPGLRCSCSISPRRWRGPRRHRAPGQHAVVDVARHHRGGRAGPSPAWCRLTAGGGDQ
ncbi:MAG: rod shape-determining protein [Alphaproteobacteria bacterium]|nr:rod shape-determining protein [Alphaproteobacteria bacterium]